MRVAVAILLALMLAQSASAATRRAEPPPAVPALEPGAKAVPVAFVRMAAAGEPLRWRGDGQDCDPAFAAALKAEFAKAGLALADNADLRLGARVTVFQARLSGKTAGAAMEVDWQVYSVSAGKVVARIHARGVAPADAKGTGLSETLAGLQRAAFAANVRALEADPRFRTLAVLAGPPPAPAALKVAYRTGARPLALKEAVGGAVVIFSDDDMGSGVLISPDGYILTNQHVAGSSGHVRIRWADGAESAGEVVRADKRRDVALIKVEAAKGRPLAIRPTPVDVGETVYAIGTPMTEAYQNTVTRGIVSATRQLDGQSFIQSDAGMTHGNSGGPLVDEKGAVVGLADLTVDASKGSTINFFIPIDEALKALSLKPAG